MLLYRRIYGASIHNDNVGNSELNQSNFEIEGL